MKSKFIVFAAIMSISIQSFAWGAVGHRAVGLIAQSRLTPQARSGVAKLIGRETLGDVANWADELRSGSDYAQATHYHFEKIPDRTSYVENLKAMSEAQREKGGVIAAILLAEEQLRMPKLKTAEKAVALKFLVHFVGDLHQPLHSGRPEDKGGVLIDVTWFGEQTSLHGVWDSRMIRSGHADLFRKAAQRADDGATYAEFLETQFKSSKVDTRTDIESWLEESMTLRPGAYDKTYLADQAKYQAAHLKDIDQRIYAAGIRLAAMVNELFDGAPMPAADVDLKSRVEGVVGDLDSIVNYKR